MKKYITDLLSRLTSRKFLITIGGITIFVTVNIPAEAYAPIVTLIGAYLASEGAGDVIQRYQAGKTETAKVQQKTDLITSGALPVDNVDTSTIQPGDAPATDIAL